MADNKLKCSFCGKSQDQVIKLIAGPGVYICNECVDLCIEILGDENVDMNPPSTRMINNVTQKGSAPSRGDAGPLESVPKEVKAAVIASLDQLIDAYETSQRPSAAEPFHRSKLVLMENQLGLNHLDLLPVLEKLAFIYENRQSWERCADAVTWQCDILSVDDELQEQRKTALVRLAQLHLKAGNFTEAERTLAVLAPLLSSQATEVKET